MRLPYLSPAELSPEQRSLYDEMRAGAAAKYRNLQTARSDGALVGPWSAWLYEPEIGNPIWGLSKALTHFKHLPEPARQIAILVVGARFRAAYEIHVHSIVGRSAGLDDTQLAAILGGTRPAGLSAESEIAFDVSTALIGGGVLDETLYRRSLDVFGKNGTNELVYLVGYYCLVSITLNGFDVPIPIVDDNAD